MDEHTKEDYLTLLNTLIEIVETTDDQVVYRLGIEALKKVGYEYEVGGN